jgi:integrase
MELTGVQERAIGSLVRVRERDWVVLPSDDPDILKLRPLSGTEAEVCGIHKGIEGADLEEAQFPPPDPQTAGDFISGRLLRDAARLSLRSGAGPFRSLGRLSVRPRPYQFVPLIMALRLDPVRMLIADDVGVGKTIEGALIARELLDRGDARRLCVMRTFFRFASESGWVPDNPAKKIRNPRVSDRPTMPFTPEEMVAILLALNKYGNSELRGVRRLAALVLLLRYSGLRISDAVTLACSRIVHDKLFLYTSKAGTPVYCPLPRSVLQALSEIPKPGERYFFWTGNSKPKTIITHWQECLQRLFELARIERGHAHRFRDTFAVELLLHGVPIERVSVLLGHKSIRVTEKHYAPWVRARQEQLEADVRRTWKTDSVLRRRTKGTPKVHAAVNCAN